jgi:hypothetical protein
MFFGYLAGIVASLMGGIMFVVRRVSHANDGDQS